MNNMGEPLHKGLDWRVESQWSLKTNGKCRDLALEGTKGQMVVQTQLDLSHRGISEVKASRLTQQSTLSKSMIDLVGRRPLRSDPQR